MTSPLPSPVPEGTAEGGGGEWWSARATLAAARTRRFAVRWGGAMGFLVLLALLFPLVRGDGDAGTRSRLERLVADTLRLGQQRRQAELAVARAESTLIAARSAPTPPMVERAERAAPSPSPVASSSEFARLIETARRETGVASVIAVAEHPAVSAGPRMRALADSLRALDARRRSAPSEETDRAIVRTRLTILSIAETRERELGPATPIAAAPVVRPEVSRAASSPATDTLPRLDTLALATRLLATRETLATAQRAFDSSVVALRAVDHTPSTAGSAAGRFSLALLLIMVLLAGVAARFLAALRQETLEPTVADAREAERVTGLRVLTVVREAPHEGPARFKPSGVDPFRMLYLGLTATGTRARTAVVTGATPEIAAAVGARLAIAAAADHRSTLVIDCDASQIAVSRTFRERPEPGLRDVLAKSFTWREVARPVGSSDGLLITLLPAGTERTDLVAGEERAAVLADFARLRAAYELTLAVAAPREVGTAIELIESSPVIVTAVVGETPIARLRDELAALRADGLKLQGLVLWAAPPPVLPSRAELAALLSARKGRTPGGSFAAVQQILGKKEGNTRT